MSPLAESRARRSPGKLRGYAAVFDSDSNDLGGFVERIAPGAFSGFGDGDVKALMNHNSDIVLGSTEARTLRLSQDRRGLAFDLELPSTSAARDLAVSVERRDVRGMSFRFETLDDLWTKLGPGRWLRTLVAVRLIEVSPTAFPAYPGTTVELRSLAADARDRRLRLLQLEASA
jgi:HK97 family phage prohead protease